MRSKIIGIVVLALVVIGFMPINSVSAENVLINSDVEVSFSSSRLRRLARAVHRSARHVHQVAEARRHHGDWAETRALRDLHHLENVARHYRNQVESWFSDYNHTWHDYLKVERAYNSARHSFRNLHAYRHVERDFSEVGRNVRELRRYYRRGGHDDDHGRWDDDHGRDPHDRDRWDRDRRRRDRERERERRRRDRDRRDRRGEH